jgi:hypothetical protein
MNTFLTIISSQIFFLNIIKISKQRLINNSFLCLVTKYTIGFNRFVCALYFIKNIVLLISYLPFDSTHHFLRNACTKLGSLQFSVFRLLTDFVCLYTNEFWLSLWKIVRSSVIFVLPLLKINVIKKMEIICNNTRKITILKNTSNKNVVIKFSAHNAFLG